MYESVLAPAAAVDGPTVRPAEPADLPAVVLADGRAFGFRYTEEDLEDLGLVLDMGHFLVACDAAGAVVGVAGAYPMAVTPPGGRPIAAEGVTWVSVSMLHRRRGVLRALMAAQLGSVAAAGVPVALLTASEGGIYGRFGYGVATTRRWTEIDRHRAEFRAGVPDPGGVRYAEADEVREHAPDVHRRWCAGQPGATSRSPGWWESLLRDRAHHRDGASALFHLLHADGYAGFRIRGRTCQVTDLFAVTAEAHAALWRALLGRDLADVVSTETLTADDPLPLLLTDARAVRTTATTDGVWARPLDLPAVLAARRYAVEVDAVLEVTDPFLGRGGRFRLRGGPDGADCGPAGGAAADVTLGVAALGSVVFGGVRPRTLARAGLLTATDDRLLGRVDAAFTAEREPRGGTNF